MLRSLFVCLAWLLGGSAIAQITVQISGPQSVNYDQSATYYATFFNANGQQINPPNPPAAEYYWSAFGFVPYNPNYDYCGGTWTQEGQQTLWFEYFVDGAYYYASMTVTVAPSPVPRPQTDVSELFSCGSTRVTRTSGPPTGANYDWWWQTSATGTSTALGNSATINLTTRTELFLRARTKSAPYIWSNGGSRLKSFDVYTMPPSVIGTTDATLFQGTSVTLATRVQLPSGTQPVFYSAAGVQLPAEPSTSSLTTAVRFYVAARNPGCINSTRLPLNVTIVPQPVVTAQNNRFFVEESSPAVLGVNGAFDSYTWTNSYGELVATTPAITIASAGEYRVVVTRNSVLGQGKTAPAFVSNGPFRQDHNYARKHVMQRQGVTQENQIESLPATQKLMAVEYIDGLGRTTQNVAWKVSPYLNDIITTREYDPSGREPKKYLPYSSNNQNGAFHPYALKDDAGTYTGSEQRKFYETPAADVAQDNAPYAETVLEASALDRPLAKGAVGEAWQSRKIGKNYGTNATADVLLFTIKDEEIFLSENLHPVYYPPNTLYLIRTTDEHGAETIEYHDTENRVVLRRVEYNHTGQTKQFAETYFVYDDFGNLAAVLAPEATRKLIDAIQFGQ